MSSLRAGTCRYEQEGWIMQTLRPQPARTLRAGLTKRIVLGLLLAAFAIVAGWALSPMIGADQATLDYVYQP